MCFVTFRSFIVDVARELIGSFVDNCEYCPMEIVSNRRNGTNKTQETFKLTYINVHCIRRLFWFMYSILYVY